MRSNAPKVAERILNEAVAIAVELILHRSQNLCSFGRSAFYDFIDVGKIYI